MNEDLQQILEHPTELENGAEAEVYASSLGLQTPPRVVPAHAPTANCPTCAAATATALAELPLPQPIRQPRWIYAIGHIELRPKSLSVEKEVAQAMAGLGNAANGLTQQQAFLLVLQQNRYLVREMCAVLLVNGIETYILIPADTSDYDLLVQATRESPNPSDLDVVIGTLGPLADPSACNGLIVPILYYQTIFSFGKEALLKSLPLPSGPAGADPVRFHDIASEVFDMVVGQSSMGATDASRASNYVCVKLASLFTTAAAFYAQNSPLTAADVVPAPLYGVGGRNLMMVILTFTNRQTGVDSKVAATVDVTGCYPFMVTPFSPYYQT